ncbi:WYL domain-containing protein [Stutzerimonas zhaodongensis]|uniref:WYL domain-containing protein n=1 Tax=Stutzerimonas zhaodongensis TaxID=1176257 RepID=UPI001F4E418D|nr:WYL domain-containing protein [Stutzerimonas zhaodongensis]UNG19278.1 WYL domain-containing protein [Stutzerimonas zhaodongensis]
MNLPKPVRPLYVWGGYFVIALLLSAATGGAEWVKTAMAIYLILAIVETIRFIRHKKKGKGRDAPAQAWINAAEKGSSSEARLDQAFEHNDDEYISGETVWTGSKQIRFNYRNSKGEYSDREVTVHKVVVGDEDTYFVGLCHMRNEPRTFRLDRVFPRNKVTDTATGEINTLRRVLGVKRRARS